MNRNTATAYSGPSYGDRRLAVFLEYAYGVEATYTPVADLDAWPMDLVNAALAHAAPFTHAVVEECRSCGPHPLWVSIGSARVLPAPGWAAKGAAWCRVCGCVAHDGHEPGCAHGNFERRP